MKVRNAQTPIKTAARHGGDGQHKAVEHDGIPYSGKTDEIAIGRFTLLVRKMVKRHQHDRGGERQPQPFRHDWPPRNHEGRDGYISQIVHDLVEVFTGKARENPFHLDRPG